MLTEQYVPEGINIVNAQNLPGQQHNVENMRNFQTFVQGKFYLNLKCIQKFPMLLFTFLIKNFFISLFSSFTL